MLTRDLNMRAGLKVAFQCLAFTSLFADFANGFFPTIFRQRMAGNGGMSHEQLTHDMYDQLVAEYFPEIRIVSAGMTRARKTITKANIAVDADEAETAASHFDGETFVAGQERLQRLYQEVIDNLDNDDAEAAQQALGGALHTLQDFYSHTNWIELGNRSPHAELGRKDKPISGIAGPGERTCNDCGPHNPLDSTASCQDCRNNTVDFTSLTSGFYFGEDVPAGGDAAIPLFKCHHGGYSDNIRGPVTGMVFGPPTPGINKDSNSCGWSPHNTLHGPAAEVALAASIQFLNDLKKDLEEVKLKQLFGIGPTLALVVDTTGSMSDIISSVRAQCLAIIDEREGTVDEPTSYILEPFNDPNIGPLTQTSDLEVFRSRINGLFASGGGDCPEYAISGMIVSTEALDGGSLFMFTDAAAKDEGRIGELISKATAKDIAIYIFKFDSGCDGASAKLKKRGDIASDRVYGEISRATGGQYRSLSRSDVGQIRGLVDTLSTANNRDVLKVQGSFTNTGTSGGSTSFKLPVDSRMTRVTFSASGPSLRMNIRTPSGSTLDLSSESVTSTFLTDGQFIIVRNPAVGVWTVALRGPSSFNLDVTGSDPLSFSAFDVVQTCGRNGHRGYCPITGPPASDHNVGAVATMDGGFSTAVFELRSLAGKVLQTLPMKPGSGEFGEPPANSFFGIFQYPVGSFYVYATGNDTAGTTYQRLLPSLITPVVSGTDNTGLEDVFITVNGTLSASISSSSSSSTTSLISSSSTGSRSQTPSVTPGVAPKPNTSSTMSMPSTLETSTTSSSSSPSSSSSSATRRVTPGVATGAAIRPSSSSSSVAAAVITPGVA